MTTAATTLLGLGLPVTGELSGTWGDVVNNSITNLLDTAIAGTTTISADADITLTTTTLASNQARQAVILWTAGGTVTRVITAPAQSKSYVVINATSSSQSIKLVGVGPTTGITIVAGEKCFAAWNGSDFVKVGNTSGAGVFTTVTATGGVDKLTSATGVVSVAAATAPSVGQVLMATSGTVATWQTVATPSAATATVLGTVYGSTPASSNVSLGYNVGTTGTYNCFVGNTAGQNITGSFNNAVGQNAMTGASPFSTNRSDAFGYGALASVTSGAFNACFGFATGNVTTSGGYNTAVGASAFQGNTTGGSNVAVGYQALVGNTTASNNTAVGYQALVGNTTASNNTAVGYQAGYSNITGAQINAFGWKALFSNTASNNVAIGAENLYSNTTGTNNSACGARDGAGYAPLYSNTTGSSNSAFGAGALALNTTASNNTALGYQSLYANTTGRQHVAIGVSALSANTTAEQNVAIGYTASQYGTTGNNNTAVGWAALNGNTTGISNVAIGSEAMQNASGSTNIAVGRYALRSTTGSSNVGVGDSAGFSKTTGDSGVFVGANAGTSLTTGTGVYIGANSTASAAGVNHEIVICYGGGATGKGASTGYIYPNGGGVYQGNNSSSWSTTSDQRLKKNIVDNNIGLEKIAAIQVRNFEYRLPEEVDAELKPTDAIKKEGVQLGVIAQELQAVLPECVKTESTGVMSVDADNLTWYMVNAIKELKAEFDAYKLTHP